MINGYVEGWNRPYMIEDALDEIEKCFGKLEAVSLIRAALELDDKEVRSNELVKAANMLRQQC